MARSQAPFITSHADLSSSSKLIDLCDALSIRRGEGIGLIHLLWHYCAKAAPDDGAVSCSKVVLADEMFWQGDPEKLFQALVDCEWIDVGTDGVARAHEWRVYGSESVLKGKKRDYDRRRLRQLRLQEDAQTQPIMPVTILGVDENVPEAVRIHLALIVDEEERLPNDQLRIQRTLDRYPNQDGYFIAIEYVAWQMDVAKQYRDHMKGLAPHIDFIKGWQNQMRHNAKNGWRLREFKEEPVRMITFTEEDKERFHTRNVSG